jgi:hypothetical protein
MEKTKNAHKIFLGNPDGKRSLRRTTHSWEHNIEIDLKEIGC